MTTTNNAIIVNKLQDLFKEWGSQFEQKPPLDVCFDVTSDNHLAVNGIVLCYIDLVDAEAATYDEEFLYIPTAAGSEYEIYLNIPFEGPGRIEHVKLVTPIYCAD